MLTVQTARELFDYDPDAGLLTWRVSRTNSVRAGSAVGYTNSRGYRRVTVGAKGSAKGYAVASVIWLWVHGRWPHGEVDHINGDRGDNRLTNLRDVPQLWNQQNKRRARSDSKTGILGVQQIGRKFRANIQSNRKTVNLGHFQTEEDAYRAYVAAKRQMHEGCTL